MHAFSFQNFGNPRAFPPPPRKNWRALPQGHLCQKIAYICISKMLATQFGERYRGGTCVSKKCINCIHVIFEIFAILRPFHPPRKNLASATAGAPACQKIAYILLLTFLQSPGPSTHPVKVWRALPRGHLRVRKFRTFFLQFL